MVADSAVIKRFFYLIIYRFSLISKKTKKFLLNKALVLELLNIVLLPEIREEYHDQSKINNSIEKGLYTPSHNILNTYKKKLNKIYDKGGAKRSIHILREHIILKIKNL